MTSRRRRSPTSPAASCCHHAMRCSSRVTAGAAWAEARRRSAAWCTGREGGVGGGRGKGGDAHTGCAPPRLPPLGTGGKASSQLPLGLLQRYHPAQTAPPPSQP
eukprot:scaffold6013_cov210-Isochrysis_galbana.AAC.4